MTHAIVPSLLVIAALTAWGCGPSSPVSVSKDPAGLSGTIKLAGSSTIAPLASELARHFEASHPGCRIDVEMGGSTRGVMDARSGQVDIGMVSRALKAEERDLIPFLVARDGIAMIVHAGVPIQELSREQIIALYEGRTKSWNDLGGPDLAVTIVNKAEGRSTLELFLHHFNLDAKDIQASVVIGDNQQGIKSVASIPGAIGYVSIGSAEAAVADGVGIRILPLGGVTASTEHVIDGTFPLARELNFVTKSPPTGLARAFLDYALSSDAAPVTEELYFVPVRK
jgi:phosphate transport system substrate-binding protein